LVNFIVASPPAELHSPPIENFLATVLVNKAAYFGMGQLVWFERFPWKMLLHQLSPGFLICSKFFHISFYYIMMS